jgi:hypothetical protein
VDDPRLDRVLDKVSTTIDRNELRNAESDARDKFALEWKQVSLVLDRVLLLVFFLAMTIASFVILTSSPHLYSFDSLQLSADDGKKHGAAAMEKKANGA